MASQFYCAVVSGGVCRGGWGCGSRGVSGLRGEGGGHSAVLSTLCAEVFVCCASVRPLADTDRESFPVLSL